MANFLTDVEDDRDEADWVIGLLAKGCGQTRREIKNKMQSGLWLVGKKAVEFGLVDSLISSK